MAPDFEHIEPAVAFQRFDRRQYFDLLPDVDRLGRFDIAMKAKELRRFGNRIGRTRMSLRPHSRRGDNQ